MKPFLKWAGNKYRIIDRIRPLLPADGKRLIEPFAGSAAVFLNTNYAENIVADFNSDLVALYQQLQSEGVGFINYCREYFTPEYNTEHSYYLFRQEFNTAKDARLRAALFLYLNRHGYNGLCRYNQKGEFNVPFGSYKKPYFPEYEMKAFFHKAQGALFVCADFRATFARVQAGDVVYCDPPYVPLTQTANFTSYSSGGFSEKDQLDLVAMAREASLRGATVVISNHDTEFVTGAYQGAQLVRFPVQRFISCDGENRGKAAEVLALFAAGESNG